MALGNLARAGRRILYVTGEESAAQVKLRAERLPEGALDVPALPETDLGTVLATLEPEKPDVCVIDSRADAGRRRADGRGRLRRPGPRGRRPHHPPGQAPGTRP